LICDPIENNDFIGVFDIDFDADIHRIGGKYYSKCMWCNPADSKDEERHALVKEIVDPKLDEESIETTLEDAITCPVCGHRDIESYEIPDEYDEYKCASCGAMLSVQREVSITYDAVLKKLPRIDNVSPIEIDIDSEQGEGKRA